jgi:hypothetical protein
MTLHGHNNSYHRNNPFGLHRQAYVGKYRETLPDLRNSYVPNGPAQFGIEYSYGRQYMYILLGSPSENQTPKHWSLTVLSPSSILPPPSSHLTLTPATKNWAWVSKILLFKFLSLVFKIA